MRLLFLCLVVVCLGIGWLAMEQPRPPEPGPEYRRLPRVADLQFLSEGKPDPELEEDGGEVSLQTQRPIATDAPALAGSGTEEPAAPGQTRPRIERPEDLGLRPLKDLFQVSPDDVPPRGEPLECLVLAGFADPASATAWAESLEPGLVASARVAARSLPQPPLSWVLVEPRGSRAEALTLLRRLQRDGIDSYLVTEGDRRNAVSLGLFESATAARQVLEARRAAGIDAVLAEYQRSREGQVLTVWTTRPRDVRDALPEKNQSEFESEGCRVLHW